MARTEDASGAHGRLSVADLRRAKPLKLFGGRSAGTVCDFCRVVITPNDPEYEVDAELDGTKIALHFHVTCYDSWRTGNPNEDPSAEPGAHDTAA
jgi:hypothetical protein